MTMKCQVCGEPVSVTNVEKHDYKQVEEYECVYGCNGRLVIPMTDDGFFLNSEAKRYGCISDQYGESRNQ